MKRKQFEPNSELRIPEKGSFSARHHHHHHSIIGIKAEAKPQTKKLGQAQLKKIITWGIQEGEPHYETSYNNHYFDNEASKHVRKLVLNIPSKPDVNLSSSLIPYETPKFMEIQKPLGRKNISDLNKSMEFSSSGRKQFPEMRHKCDGGHNLSLDSQHYESSILTRTASAEKISIAKLLKNMHLYHSQVQENFCTEPPALSDLHKQHLFLYSEGFDETNRAGSSDLKKRLAPPKKGIRLFSSQTPEPEINDVIKHSFVNFDDQNHTHKEITSSLINPHHAFQLRAPDYIERYSRKFSADSGQIKTIPRYSPDLKKSSVNFETFLEPQETINIKSSPEKISVIRTESNRSLINSSDTEKRKNIPLNLKAEKKGVTQPFASKLGPGKILTQASKLKQGSFSGINKKYIA